MRWHLASDLPGGAGAPAGDPGGLGGGAGGPAGTKNQFSPPIMEKIRDSLQQQQQQQHKQQQQQQQQQSGGSRKRRIFRGVLIDAGTSSKE